MPTWLETMAEANEAFMGRVEPARLPVARPAGQFAVVTCIDPRVNVEAIGVAPADRDGGLGSAVRVIRTAAGIPEYRSLVAGIHMGGIQEVAVLMHTDCGAITAWHRTDELLANLRRNLGTGFPAFAEVVGGSDTTSLRAWLRVFDDPYTAIVREVERLVGQPFMPSTTPVHGLVYDVETGRVDVVVNGYS